MSCIRSCFSGCVHPKEVSPYKDLACQHMCADFGDIMTALFFITVGTSVMAQLTVYTGSCGFFVAGSAVAAFALTIQISDLYKISKISLPSIEKDANLESEYRKSDILARAMLINLTVTALAVFIIYANMTSIGGMNSLNYIVGFGIAGLSIGGSLFIGWVYQNCRYYYAAKQLDLKTKLPTEAQPPA